VLGRHLGLSTEQVKKLIPVGAAAAIAAAFNTPLAAVVFALEEIMGDLNAPMMGGVVLASATAWVVLRLLLGDAEEGRSILDGPAYRDRDFVLIDESLECPRRVGPMLAHGQYQLGAVARRRAPAPADAESDPHPTGNGHAADGHANLDTRVLSEFECRSARLLQRRRPPWCSDRWFTA